MPATRPLRSLLFRLTLIPVLAVAVILVFIGIYRSNTIIVEIVHDQRNHLQSIRKLDTLYLEETGHMVQTLARLLTEEEIPQHQQKILATARESFPRFTGLYLLDAQGKVILENTDGLSLLGLDRSGEAFFREGMRQAEVYYSDPFISLTSGRITVIVAAAYILDGKAQGMLAGELNLEYLQQVVAEMAQGREATTYFVDGRGTVVIHPDQRWVQEQRNLSDLELIRQARSNSTAFRFYRQKETGDWVLGSAAAMPHGWVVVTEERLVAVLQPVFALTAIVGIAFVLALVGFRWAQRYSVIRITRPITELARSADALAHGQEEVLPDVAHAEFTELATLSASFAGMFRAVQERTAQLEQANRELERANAALAEANRELAHANSALEVSNTELAEQIQERQRAEEAVRQLNFDLEDRVLERTSQLEAAVRELDAFSYSISHDLRAPLRGIDGFSQAVLEEYGEPLGETGRGYLGRVREATRKMNAQIEALLKLSRLSRAAMYIQPVNLSEIARGILVELQESTPERQVEIFVQDNLTARADLNLLMVVMDNLLRNAWKFSAPNLQARIDVGSLAGEDNTLIYFVKDNGVGFDKTLTHRLFGPFQRLHSETDFEGTGIGLATVQRVIRRHGGQVWAESEPGVGATFFFTLPESS